MPTGSGPWQNAPSGGAWAHGQATLRGEAGPGTPRPRRALRRQVRKQGLPLKTRGVLPSTEGTCARWLEGEWGTCRRFFPGDLGAFPFWKQQVDQVCRPGSGCLAWTREGRVELRQL